MSDASERVAAPCPACSPDAETVHEVLSTGGGRVTIRCTECGHVHKEEPPETETVTRNVVVSQEDTSFTAPVEAPADEVVAVGEEFVLDTDEAIMAVRITGLEIADERRVERAPVRDVETFWTRAVDNVSVNVTIHPRDGRHDETRSVKLGVPGDHEFAVGATEAHGDEQFTIEGIHVRDDAAGYPTPKLDHAGDTAPAKDVKRVYARDETSDAWSAW